MRCPTSPSAAGRSPSIAGTVPRLDQDFDRLPLRRPLPATRCERCRSGAAAAVPFRPRPRGALRAVREACRRDRSPATASAGRAEATEPCRAARRRPRTPLLEVRDYRVWFPIRKGAAEAHRRLREGGRRRLVHAAGRADARPGRRVRAAARRRSARRCCSCCAHSADISGERAARRPGPLDARRRGAAPRAPRRCRSSSRIRSRR